MILGNVGEDGTLVALEGGGEVCKLYELRSCDGLVGLVGIGGKTEEVAGLVKICYCVVEPVALLYVGKAGGISVGNGLLAEKETCENRTSLGSGHISVGAEGVTLVAVDVSGVSAVVLHSYLRKACVNGRCLESAYLVKLDSSDARLVDALEGICPGNAYLGVILGNLGEKHRGVIRVSTIVGVSTDKCGLNASLVCNLVGKNARCSTYVCGDYCKNVVKLCHSVIPYALTVTSLVDIGEVVAVELGGTYCLEARCPIPHGVHFAALVDEGAGVNDYVLVGISGNGFDKPIESARSRPMLKREYEVLGTVVLNYGVAVVFVKKLALALGYVILGGHIGCHKVVSAASVGNVVVKTDGDTHRHILGCESACGGNYSLVLSIPALVCEAELYKLVVVIACRGETVGRARGESSYEAYELEVIVVLLIEEPEG